MNELDASEPRFKRWLFGTWLSIDIIGWFCVLFIWHTAGSGIVIYSGASVVGLLGMVLLMFM
jgi:hypothetical protein